jgi:ABC-type antimicrobial peptide transport system permease subunit
MIRNYIKLALRSLAKNKLVSFINIFGLSTAIGVSVAVFAYVDFEYNVDQVHENVDNIFLVENVVERDGKEQLWGDSPAPIGAMLKQDYPQIKSVVRIDNRGLVLKYDDKVFNERCRFVDPEFMDMFTYPVKFGDKNTLNDPTRIIISHEISVKYFGDSNPVGEQIVMNFGKDRIESFIIGAVAEDYPPVYSFDFDILINWDRKYEIFTDEDENDWKDFINATFIQLENKDDIDIIESGMGKYIDLQNEVEKDWPAKSYPTHPLATLSLNSYLIDGSISNGDEPTGRIVLSVIGIFLLALAIFNYMNIAIVSAAKRLKEIGLRKSIGGTRSQLVRQFLIENVMLSIFALILGTLIAHFVVLPWFKNQFGLGLQLDIFGNYRLWLFFLGLLVFVGLASGAYPAFYISSFKPTDIFRGGFKIAGKNRFTRIFLTFQFVLALIAIVSGIIFVQNVKYQKAQDWGYDKENIYVVQVPTGDTYRALRDRALQNPNVLSVVGSGGLVGRSWGLAVIDKNDKKTEVRRIDVGPNYFETLDLPLREGRAFKEGMKTDEQAVIVNELFVDRVGWENIIDNTFIYDSVEYSIIGIVDNFYYQSFWNEIEPMMLRLVPEEDFRYVSAKIKTGTALESAEFFEASWKELEPDLPYNGFFQDSLFDNYFNNIVGHSKLIGFTATLAIILSCMGLFGLVSLNVASKMKEFSIRKVLGAGSMSIAKRVNLQYVWLLIIATVFGAPLSYLAMVALLDSVYEYHVPVQMVSILLGIFMIFLVALLTVSSLVVKVVRSNPVNALRSE